MTETETVPFSQLSEAAKEAAREEYRERDPLDDWWEYTYEHATTAGRLMGIDVEQIFFSGFWSQGDGACFEGAYGFAPNGPARIRDEFGEHDEELTRIAGALDQMQRVPIVTARLLGNDGCEGFHARVSHSGNYYHEYSTTIEVECCEDHEVTAEQDKELASHLRAFMKWIYRKLEAEYDYLMSDEVVDGALADYEFDEDGRRI